MKKKHIVCVVTSTRADYGIMRPLISRFHKEESIDLRLVVTGMHLCQEFGKTVSEILEDGFPIHKCIDIQLSSDEPSGMSKTMGMALISFADYFSSYTPNLLIVLGDRYEIAAICCASLNQRIPIAHLHGGELTKGLIDNAYRHMITKMSSLHFTSTEVYKSRVIQMGESPQTVFNVGAMGVENALFNDKHYTLAELSHYLDFELTEKKYAVVTFHPVTLENNTALSQVAYLMKAMDCFPKLKFVITKSNSDAEGRKINALWEDYVAKRNNCKLVNFLGIIRYQSLLTHAAMVIGNSSSGILECPVLKIPTVNIGDRQKGRIRAVSVLDCLPTKEHIEECIKKALSVEFQELTKMCDNPYGDGQTSSRIFDVVYDFLTAGFLEIQKDFFDYNV